MALYLREDTASQEILLGPFLDETDGATAENGLTIANTDIKLFKSGATSLTNKNSGGATYITSSSGLYYAVLDATDTDTCGNLVVFCHMDANALPVRHEFVVLQANVYDSLIGGTTYLETNPGKFSISSTTLSLKNRAGAEDSTRTITATAGADPVTGLS